MFSTIEKNVFKLSDMHFSVPTLNTTNWNKFGETPTMRGRNEGGPTMFGIIYNSSAFNANEASNRIKSIGRYVRCGRPTNQYINSVEMDRVNWSQLESTGVNSSKLESILGKSQLISSKRCCKHLKRWGNMQFAYYIYKFKLVLH